MSEGRHPIIDDTLTDADQADQRAALTGGSVERRLSIGSRSLSVAIALVGIVLFVYHPIPLQWWLYVIVGLALVVTGGVMYLMKGTFAVYKPTGERFGLCDFRYFDPGEEGRLLDLFARQDYAGMAQLKFALDGEGATDTSSLLISMTGTPSASAVLVQIEKYIDSSPVGVVPVRMYTGEEAKRVWPVLKGLSQAR